MSTRLVCGFMLTPLARTLPVAPALAAAAAFATAAAYWNADVRFAPPAKILIEVVCRCPILALPKLKCWLVALTTWIFISTSPSNCWKQIGFDISQRCTAMTNAKKKMVQIGHSVIGLQTTDAATFLKEFGLRMQDIARYCKPGYGIDTLSCQNTHYVLPYYILCTFNALQVSFCL